MSWSPLQREMLEAMGLSPYRLASATVAEATTHAPEPSMHGRAATAGANVDAMTAALLRAAGFGPDDDARETLFGLCPAPQALRGDAGAKRALWPRLRAMRRG